MPIIPPILRSTTAGAPRLFSRLHAIERFLRRIPPPAEILEIGSGLGDLAAHLLDRYPAARVRLAEVSPEAAEGLRVRFRGHSRVEVFQGDVLAGADLRPRFDLAIACEVFEHIEEDAAGLRDLGTLIKPGGWFIFSAPCHMKKWQAADEFAGHYRRYEREELIGKLESAGLAIDELWTFGFPSVNLVQPVRDFYYRSRKGEARVDKQSATEKSGIDRPAAMRYAKWLVLAAMLPLLPIEALFWRREWGDGFLVLARKRPELGGAIV